MVRERRPFAVTERHGRCCCIPWQQQRNERKALRGSDRPWAPLGAAPRSHSGRGLLRQPLANAAAPVVAPPAEARLVWLGRERGAGGHPRRAAGCTPQGQGHSGRRDGTATRVLELPPSRTLFEHAPAVRADAVHLTVVVGLEQAADAAGAGGLEVQAAWPLQGPPGRSRATWRARRRRRRRATPPRRMLCGRAAFTGALDPLAGGAACPWMTGRRAGAANRPGPPPDSCPRPCASASKRRGAVPTRLAPQALPLSGEFTSASGALGQGLQPRQTDSAANGGGPPDDLPARPPRLTQRGAASSRFLTANRSRST